MTESKLCDTNYYINNVESSSRQSHELYCVIHIGCSFQLLLSVAADDAALTGPSIAMIIPAAPASSTSLETEQIINLIKLSQQVPQNQTNLVPQKLNRQSGNYSPIPNKRPDKKKATTKALFKYLCASGKIIYHRNWGSTVMKPFLIQWKQKVWQTSSLPHIGFHQSSKNHCISETPWNRNSKALSPQDN